MFSMNFPTERIHEFPVENQDSQKINQRKYRRGQRRRTWFYKNPTSCWCSENRLSENREYFCAHQTRRENYYYRRREEGSARQGWVFNKNQQRPVQFNIDGCCREASERDAILPQNILDKTRLVLAEVLCGGVCSHYYESHGPWESTCNDESYLRV